MSPPPSPALGTFPKLHPPILTTLKLFSFMVANILLEQVSGLQVVSPKHTWRVSLTEVITSSFRAFPHQQAASCRRKLFISFLSHQSFAKMIMNHFHCVVWRVPVSLSRPNCESVDDIDQRQSTVSSRSFAGCSKWHRERTLEFNMKKCWNTEWVCCGTAGYQRTLKGFKMTASSNLP